MKRNENGRYEVKFTCEHFLSDGYKNHSLGTHHATLELWEENGVPRMIEWDIPALEETEHIGLWFDGKELCDYDGVTEMPEQAIKMLEDLGYNCDYARDTQLPED